ncbi:efflux RND transporter periplasmic adaptor subunit [Ignavibacterium sp.]|uniref:efflux RND transporter periplasmic adaptor subunit n=1 Tax=Ignavibacterium sp. TaxID=2651167 RepID=UPI0021FB973C|nr:efflux RND transporter periplasmic adaptor subunit [Ignavibacterium sp.]BDQ03102.1 MAG: MexH family multidrug efflux RND transporter periplasmic adaptor subunit [Ignavibacterium sp.]
MNKAKSLLIILLSALIVVSCGKKENNNQNKTDETIPVEVTLVKKSMIDREIELVGNLMAWKEANLAAQTTARVQKIYVDAGSRVKEGDLLFEMDDTQLAQSKIQYQVAKDNYDRLKPLYESGSISQSQFDQVKAAYETSEKAYQLLLTNTQFRAPFSGVVTAKRLNEGEVFLLAPGGVGAPTIVSLMQINPLKLILNVSESNLKDVKLNQTVEIKSDIFPDETFRGTINRINPAVNPSSRTFEVEVKIPNPNEKLKPGMYVRAKILIGKTEGIIVNRSAALKQLGSTAYYGFIVKDNTAKRVELTLGKEFDSLVEITSGLNEGDYVVTRGQGLLKDGSKVEIKVKAE